MASTSNSGDSMKGTRKNAEVAPAPFESERSNEEPALKKQRQAAGPSSQAEDDHEMAETTEEKEQHKTIAKGSNPAAETAQHLPIAQCKDVILKLVRENPVVVITGDTGSGKSTQLAKYLWEDSGKDTRVCVTQPRRIGAVSVARRVAEEMGVKLGEEVGFTIRFEDHTSSATRIKYVTDGVLLRECLEDPLLKAYDIIVLDEAHERSLQTDVLFGIIKKLVASGQRPDLKVVVTSATLNVSKFCEYFSCTSYHVPGRCFPVDIFHMSKTPRFYMEAAVTKVMDIHTKEGPGHILVFLTGQDEIDRCCKLIGRKVDEYLDDGVSMPEIVILPIYSSLQSHLQQRIFQPTADGCRKVVVSTNLCETSLTVDGIVYVVDGGHVKQRQYNPKTGIDALSVVPVSQVAAVQRAGRAGRTQRGQCHRLYSEETFQSFGAESIPEIQRISLASTVLLLKSLGVADPLTFDFLDKPSTDALCEALRKLFFLGAISADGVITALGKSMSMFPLEPHLAKLLITAVHYGCLDEILTITAMLSAENVWVRPGQKEERELAEEHHMLFASAYGDHVSLLFTYDQWVAAKGSRQWCEEHFIHFRNMKKAKDVRGQLDDIIKKALNRRDFPATIKDLEIPDECLPGLHAGTGDTFSAYDAYRRGKRIRDDVWVVDTVTRARMAIAHSLFMHTARRVNEPEHSRATAYKLHCEQDALQVYIHPSSCVSVVPPKWVVYEELVYTAKPYMRQVSEIEYSWIRKLLPRVAEASIPQLAGASLRDALDDEEKRHAEPTAKPPEPDAKEVKKRGVRFDDEATKANLPTAASSATKALLARQRYLERKKGVPK